MTSPLQIICAGLVGWDSIGRTPLGMVTGNDLPGLIESNVGGVATNIAVALANQINSNSNFEVILLSSTGNDQKSDLLLSLLSERHKVNTTYIIRDKGTSDGYICIESKGELFSAVASSAQLEKSCTKIFKPFKKSRQQTKKLICPEYLVVDSNLTPKTINYLSSDPLFSKTKFVIACASPHKASKVLPLIKKRQCSIYSNLYEASSILGFIPTNSVEAANGLFDLGAKEAIVTDGKKLASSRSNAGLFSVAPQKVSNIKVTGAGDAFVAAHVLPLILGERLSPLERLKVAELAARKEISSQLES